MRQKHVVFSILKADDRWTAVSDRSDMPVHHLNAWRGTALYSTTTAGQSIHIYKQISAVSFKATYFECPQYLLLIRGHTLPRNKENYIRKYSTKMYLGHLNCQSADYISAIHSRKKSWETLHGVQRSSRGVNAVLTLNDKSTYFTIKSFRQQVVGFLFTATTMKDNVILWEHNWHSMWIGFRFLKITHALWHTLHSFLLNTITI